MVKIRNCIQTVSHRWRRPAGSYLLADQSLLGDGIFVILCGKRQITTQSISKILKMQELLSVDHRLAQHCVNLLVDGDFKDIYLQENLKSDFKHFMHDALYARVCV